MLGGLLVDAVWTFDDYKSESLIGVVAYRLYSLRDATGRGKCSLKLVFICIGLYWLTAFAPTFELAQEYSGLICLAFSVQDTSA